MFQDETQPENHLERSTALPLQPRLPDAEVQRKRMLIALGILLVELVAVVLKDWDLWYPSGCGLGRNVFSIRRPGAECAGQCRRSGAALAANGAECECFGATGLSLAGAADEGAGRGQFAGAHLARRIHPGVADSQW